MNQLQMVSFSSSAKLAALGDEITITCKLKNISGAAIRYWSVGAGINERTITNQTTGNGYVVNAYAVGSSSALDPVTWAAGKSKTFTWTITLPESAKLIFTTHSTRATPMTIEFLTGYSLNSLAIDNYITDVQVLAERYRPAVDEFIVRRAIGSEVNDEGKNALVSVKLSQAENAPSQWAKCNIVFMQAGAASGTDVDCTSRIPALLTGVDNAQGIITSQVDTSYEYLFRISFGDDYENDVRYFPLDMSFANFAQAQCGKGVSFGGFPRSTVEKPLTESHYPIIPYDGVAGVNIYEPNKAVVTTAGRWIDGRPIHRITVELPALSKNVTQLIELGVPGDSVSAIVSIDGVFDAGDGAWMSLMYSNDTTNSFKYHVRTAVINVGTANSQLTLRLITGEERTIAGGHATIAYVSKESD